MQEFENIDVFSINVQKVLTFRRETDFFVSYDPTELESYTLNEIGAEIMWLISHNVQYKDIVQYFVANYNIEKEEFESDLHEFIRHYRCRHLIDQRLGELGFEAYEQVS